MEDLTAPLRALRLLALDFADLPAPTVLVSPLYSARFDLSLHDDLGAFEPWRTALHIARDAVDFHTQSDGKTWVLEAYTHFAGATVRLIAFGAARVPERPRVAGIGH